MSAPEQRPSLPLHPGPPSSPFPLLAFDVRGALAHFRRPDTLVTQATYPFIPRTTLRGMLAAVLGLDELPESQQGTEWLGLRLLSPIRTVTQELSLLGKGWIGTDKSFHRPTAVEFLVNPHYRVYYAGPYLEALQQNLRRGQSVYPTYLGVAYCLTVPTYVATLQAEPLPASPLPTSISTYTVVPAPAIAQLRPRPGASYARAGGIPYRHLGERHFAGTLTLIYETNGGALEFAPVATSSQTDAKAAGADDPPYLLCRLQAHGETKDEVISLW
ncbi:MAG: CRISPR-associated protein Cas5 [Limnochordaceae bacterium]|nr:CRISPR-associated protein Cas5 [Limnochordaceae bacterium]